jgi:DNA-binding NarL/FixJ family response regulator
MIVDDHELLAESLRLALVSEGYDVVVPVARPAEVYDAAQRTPPDVVLLDLDLGAAGGDGSVMVEALCVDGARVVILSGTRDRLLLAACLEAGAAGFVAKSAPLEDLLAAVHAASRGAAVTTDQARADLLAELRAARRQRRDQLAPFDSLTGRERFVLAQVIDGRSAADIAASSFVSEATVRTQIRGVLGKLGVRSQLAAVAAARRAGWRLVGGSAEHSTVGG